MNYLKLTSIVASLFLAVNVYAQEPLQRLVFMDSVKNELVIRKFNRIPMKFASPLNRLDTLYIGVMADSISATTMNLKVYGYFPTNIRINDMNIILEYMDGSEDTFKLVGFDQYNYGTFDIVNDLSFIYNKALKKIKFRNFAVYTVQPKNKNFFIDFFKQFN